MLLKIKKRLEKLFARKEQKEPLAIANPPHKQFFLSGKTLPLPVMEFPKIDHELFKTPDIRPKIHGDEGQKIKRQIEGNIRRAEGYIQNYPFFERLCWQKGFDISKAYKHSGTRLAIEKRAEDIKNYIQNHNV